MDCKNIEGILIDYIEHELKPDEQKQVEEHLSACDNCQKQLNELKQLFANLDQERVLEPDWVSIRKKIHEKTREKKLMLLPYLVPIAVAALVLFFVFRPRNGKEIDLMIPASPSQLVYGSSDRVQEKILAGLVDSVLAYRLQNLNSDLLESADFSSLLDDLSTTEKEALYKNIKEQFGEYL